MRRTTYVFADGSTTVDYKKAVESGKRFTVKMVEIKDEELLDEKTRKKVIEAREKSRKLRDEERKIRKINELYDEMYRIEKEA